MAKAGTAYVDIDARLDKMRATLQRGTRNLKADLDVEIDRTQVLAQLRRLTAPLTLDIDRTKLAATMKALGLRLEVEGHWDQGSLARMRAELEAVVGRVDVNVSADASSLVALRAAVNGALAGVSINPTGAAVSGAGGAAAGGAIGGGLLGMLGIGAGAAAVGTVGALGAYGATLASGIENADMAFRRMLGSAEAADAMIRDLQAFAARTPFEFKGLRETAAQLLAAKVPAEDIIPILESVGDATSAMGTGAFGVDRAAYALVQMQQATKVTGMEMRQLTEAGIPAWEALAAEMGVPIERLKEMVSAGEVPAQRMFDAIQNRAGSTFKTLEGGMAEAATTMTGQLSNLKDAFDIGLGEAAKPFMDSMKDMIAMVNTSFMPSFTEVLKPALEALAPFVTSLAQSFAPLLNTFVAVGGSIMQSLQPALDTILPIFTDLATRVGVSFGALLVELAPAFEDIAFAVVALLRPLEPLFGIFAELAATVLPPLAEALAMIAGTFAAALLPVLEDLRPVFRDMAEKFATKLADIMPRLVPAVQALAEAFVGLIPALVPLIEKVAEVGTDLWIEMLEAFIELTPTIVALTDAFIGLLPLITPLVELMAAQGMVMIDGLIKVAPYLATIAEGLALTADAVGRVLGDGLERVVDLLVTLFGLDFEGAKKWWGEFVDDFLAGWDRVTDRFSDGWDTVIEGVKTGLNTIIKLWNEMRIPEFGPFTVPGPFGTSLDIGPWGPFDLPDLPVLHSGGVYEAPGGAGEGLALLRHGEYVVTPEEIAAANLGGGSSRPVVVNQTVNGPDINPKMLGDFAARRLARMVAVHA